MGFCPFDESKTSSAKDPLLQFVSLEIAKDDSREREKISQERGRRNHTPKIRNRKKRTHKKIKNQEKMKIHTQEKGKKIKYTHTRKGKKSGKK